MHGTLSGTFQGDEGDPAWRADYLSALRELMGDQLLLPAPDGARTGAVLGIPVRTEAEVWTFTGKALRAAILRQMKVSRTANPFVREVQWQGLKAGEVAQSPWRPLVWLSSKDKRTPFYSLTDAAVFTVYEHLVSGGEVAE